GAAPAIVELGVDGDDGLAGAGGALGDRAADVARPAERRAIDAAGDGDLERAALLEEQKAALGAGQLDGGVDDVVEQRLEAKLGVQAPAQGQKPAQSV